MALPFFVFYTTRNYIYLLPIKRFDAMQSLKIYETYMHFGRIADYGKLGPFWEALFLRILSINGRLMPICQL